MGGTLLKTDPTSDEELELQYSPSRWSSRLPPEIIVDKHVQVVRQLSERFRPAVVLPYGDSGETVLNVFTRETIEGSRSYADSLTLAPTTRNPLARFDDAAPATKETLAGDDESLPNALSLKPPTSKQPNRFFSAADRAPYVVFIHGGYWQALDVASSAYFADVVTSQGYHFVALGYDLAPKLRLSEIVSQVRRGFAAIVKRASAEGTWVVAVGHSAGGHLAAMLMLTDWKQFDIEDDQRKKAFRGIFPISGVYDLRPLLRTSVNDALGMDKEEAEANSPTPLLNRLFAEEIHPHRVQESTLTSSLSFEESTWERGFKDVGRGGHCVDNPTTKRIYHVGGFGGGGRDKRDADEDINDTGKSAAAADDDDDDDAESIATAKKPPFRVGVIVAEHDSPAFRQQSLRFADVCSLISNTTVASSSTSSLRKSLTSVFVDMKVEFQEISGADHFDVVERLAEPDFVLTKTLISWLRSID